MIPVKIERRPLREDVYSALLDRVYRRFFAPGEPLNDAALAKELGVSRTPVREALLRLEREGIVQAQMGRGFLVRPLDVAEVHELYPMVWTLEQLGMKSSPPYTPSEIRKLRRINDQFARARDPFDSVRLDDEFHNALIARCGNRRLLDTIAQIKRMLRRYELTFMREADGSDASSRTHAEILDALQSGDLDRAMAAHERNWRRALDLVAGWIEDSQDPGRSLQTTSIE